MLKLFSGRQQKLVDAITTADLDKLAKLLTKFEATELDAPLHEKQSAVELTIRAQQPKSLELILNRGCNTNALASCDTPLVLLALHQPENSLGLLTQLLRAGADANTTGLLSACFTHCDEAELMVHISRLIEHGCQISEDADLMAQALATALCKRCNAADKTPRERPPGCLVSVHGRRCASWKENSQKLAKRNLPQTLTR